MKQPLSSDMCDDDLFQSKQNVSFAPSAGSSSTNRIFPIRSAVKTWQASSPASLCQIEPTIVNPKDTDGVEVSGLSNKSLRNHNGHLQAESLGDPTLDEPLPQNVATQGSIAQSSRTRKSEVRESGLLGPACADDGNGTALRHAEKSFEHCNSVQEFGALIVLADTGKLNMFPVLAASKNTSEILGISASDLMALEGFSEVLTEEAIGDLADRIDLIRDLGNNFGQGPEVFQLQFFPRAGRGRSLWCALHLNAAGLIVLEFELKDERCCPPSPMHTPHSTQYHDQIDDHELSIKTSNT